MALSDYLYSAASDVAARSGVTITAESNVTPPVVLYDAASTAPSLLDALGIQTHIVAKTANGTVLASYGSPVQRNYPLMLVYGFAIVAVAAFLGVAVVRGIKKG